MTEKTERYRVLGELLKECQDELTELAMDEDAEEEEQESEPPKRETRLKPSDLLKKAILYGNLKDYGYYHDGKAWIAFNGLKITPSSVTFTNKGEDMATLDFNTVLSPGETIMLQFKDLSGEFPMTIE